MRFNEPAHVKDILNDILPIDIINASDRFYHEMLGLGDAEKKRIRFREVFFTQCFLRLLGTMAVTGWYRVQ